MSPVGAVCLLRVPLRNIKMCLHYLVSIASTSILCLHSGGQFISYLNSQLSNPTRNSTGTTYAMARDSMRVQVTFRRARTGLIILVHESNLRLSTIPALAPS